MFFWNVGSGKVQRPRNNGRGWTAKKQWWLYLSLFTAFGLHCNESVVRVGFGGAGRAFARGREIFSYRREFVVLLCVLALVVVSCIFTQM